MVINQLLHIPHDLCISLVCSLRHLRDGSGGRNVWFPRCGGLGVEDEGHGEEALEISSWSIMRD